MMKVRLASEIQPDSILDGSGIRTRSEEHV